MQSDRSRVWAKILTEELGADAVALLDVWSAEDGAVDEGQQSRLVGNSVGRLQLVNHQVEPIPASVAHLLPVDTFIYVSLSA